MNSGGVDCDGDWTAETKSAHGYCNSLAPSEEVVNSLEESIMLANWSLITLRAALTRRDVIRQR